MQGPTCPLPTTAGKLERKVHFVQSTSEELSIFSVRTWWIIINYPFFPCNSAQQRSPCMLFLPSLHGSSAARQLPCHCGELRATWIQSFGSFFLNQHRCWNSWLKNGRKLIKKPGCAKFQGSNNRWLPPSEDTFAASVATPVAFSCWNLIFGLLA